jgi:hypothetical protein
MAVFRRGMMRRFVVSIVCLAAVFAFAVSDASAFGLGVYHGMGWGSGEQTIDFDNDYEYTYEGKTDHWGAGLVFDTAVAKNRLINYRLKIGYESLNFDVDDAFYKVGGRTVHINTDDYSRELEMDGIMMEHAFGFGVIRGKRVRLWLGPEVRFAYLGGRPKVGGDLQEDEEFEMYGFGFGPVVGLNLNLGSMVTLAWDTGFHYTLYFGEYTDSDGDNEETADYDEKVSEFFANFSLIFRIDDKF